MRIRNKVISDRNHRIIWWTAYLFWVTVIIFVPPLTPWNGWADYPIIIVGFLVWYIFYLLKWTKQSDYNDING